MLNSLLESQLFIQNAGSTLLEFSSTCTSFFIFFYFLFMFLFFIFLIIIYFFHVLWVGQVFLRTFTSCENCFMAFFYLFFGNEFGACKVDLYGHSRRYDSTANLDMARRSIVSRDRWTPTTMILFPFCFIWDRAILPKDF